VASFCPSSAARVVIDEMVVRDGPIWTAGSAFAHIDLMLALMRHLGGAALTDELANRWVAAQRASQASLSAAKTTTTTMLHAAWRAAGFSAGALTTIDFRVDDRVEQNTTRQTTLEAIMTLDQALEWAKVFAPLICSWPFVVFVFVVYFRKPIAMIIANTTSFKIGAIELLSGLRNLVSRPTPLQPASPDTLNAVVKSLTPKTCAYLIEVANRDLRLDAHAEVIARQFGEMTPGFVERLLGLGQGKRALNAGYVLALFGNFQGILFTVKSSIENPAAESVADVRFTVLIPDNVLTLLKARADAR